MNILFVTDKFPTISETFILDQVTGLIEKGHDVRVISWSSEGDRLSGDYDRYRLNDRIIVMRRHVPKSLIKRYVAAFGNIMRLLVSSPGKMLSLYSIKYGKLSFGLIPFYVADSLMHTPWKADVVVAHFGTNGLIVSALKNSGIIAKETPCFTFFHAYEISGLSQEETHHMYLPMMKDDSIFLPINKLWYNKLLMAGVGKDKIKLCHMGVDLANITYRPRIFDKNTLHIISVGRLVEKKAHEYSIKAVAKLLSKTQSNIQFDIIGEGPMQSKLESLIRNLDIESHVHLKGPMPHEAVKEALESAHVFLLPSITSSTGDMEGIPVSLMEAMASGLICVSTFHSGIPELIDNRITGYLCQEKSVDDIVDALSEILSETQTKLNGISMAARKKVEKEFNRNQLLDDFVEMLSKTVDA